MKSRLGNEGNGVNPTSRFFIMKSGNDRTTGALCRSWTRTMLSMERRLNVHGEKVACSLRTRCFMIIYGPDEYAPPGKLNNREEVF